MLRGKRTKFFMHFFLCTLCAIFFNEYLIYYITLWSCKWPLLKAINEKHVATSTLRFIVLSDPHLLGERQGHWFDKLRREWQMYRSYQTALRLFKPHAVFILGDIFDEGKWATTQQWEKYVRRAREVFHTPEHIDLHMIVGNHDVGFHDHISEYKLKRFYRAFNTDHVKVVTSHGNVFVLLNSMAFHGDHCFMCSDMQSQLKKISKALSCSQNEEVNDECRELLRYPRSKPVVLQHFPLYRESDASCCCEDAASKSELKRFTPKHDTISQDASMKILQLLKPRLLMSGHTHDGCEYYHDDGILEISVPSFSWRNRPNPSFILVTMTEDDFATSKCFLPNEYTVIISYVILAIIMIYKISRLFIKYI